jgi:peroxiredoxin Q/BCP
MKNMIYVIALLTALPIAVLAQTSSDSLKVGDQAPDFSLPFATRDSVASQQLKLSEMVGTKNIVLAFYPADWSGGCTKEVCTMRDNFSDLGKLNADVVAISGDYQFSHHEWAKDLNLPFRLASDHLHKVAQRYSSYNAEHGMNKRTVYVVDKSGKIAYIDLKYNAQGLDSFNKLQDALKKLQ